MAEDNTIVLGERGEPSGNAPSGKVYVWVDGNGVVWTKDDTGALKSAIGVTVHDDLTGKSVADQHPISAITGLQSALDDNDLSDIFEDTLEPSGFILNDPDSCGIIEVSKNGTEVKRIDENNTFTMSTGGTFYDGTSAVTRTFRISPKSGSDLEVYIGAVKTTIVAQSLQFPDVDGAHVFYLDENGDIQTSTEMEERMFYDNPVVSIIYWNSTHQEVFLFANERHGIVQDGFSHQYVHGTHGAAYRSGMAPLGLTDGSSTFTGIDSGIFFDEDIKFSLPLQNDIPFWYMDGSTWVQTTADDSVGYIHNSDTRVSYNEDTGTVFQLTELLTDEEAMVIFILATNDARYPYAKVLGQRKYLNGDNAEGDISDHYHSLDFGDIPTPEFILTGAIIVTGDGNLSVQSCGCGYYDFRTGFQQKFGTGFAEVHDDSEMSNGDSTYLEYISLATQNNDQGKYRIGVGTTWRHSATGNNIQIQVLCNGAVLGLLEIEPKDTGSDIRYHNYGVFYYEQASYGDMEITLEFRPENSSNTSYIYAGVIEKWRVV